MYLVRRQTYLHGGNEMDRVKRGDGGDMMDDWEEDGGEEDNNDDG